MRKNEFCFECKMDYHGQETPCSRCNLFDDEPEVDLFDTTGVDNNLFGEYDE